GCRGGRLRRGRSPGERKRRASGRGGERDPGLDRPGARHGGRRGVGDRLSGSGARGRAALRRSGPMRASSVRRREVMAAAAQTACLMEVVAQKPGNVYRGRDLPGLTYRELVLSAYAIGPAFGAGAKGRVGRLVLEAVNATRRHVGTNTNLGII